MDRRTFLQNAAATAIAASASGATALPPKLVSKKMIGIQIGAVSFVDEGVEPVLDHCEESAGVNTLFVATFTYGRGIAGRQIPGQPLPDHGKQQYDTDTFFGGSYTAVHPQYYKDTVFKDFRAPDLGNYDVLEQVLPAAKKRGMKVICWYEDVFRRNLPNIESLCHMLHFRNILLQRIAQGQTHLGLIPGNTIITIIESNLVGPVIVGSPPIIGKLVVHPKPDEECDSHPRRQP